MVEWHKRTGGCIALRLAGLALQGGVWLIGHRLAQMVEAYPHETSPPEFLLGMALFACLSIGIALAIIGPGLFEKVTVSVRWVIRTDLPRMPEDSTDQSEWP